MRAGQTKTWQLEVRRQLAYPAGPATFESADAWGMYLKLRDRVA